jgi:mono/diheme cytochrome c family protein
MKTFLVVGMFGLLLLASLAAIAQPRPDLVKEGERLFQAQGCYGCHMVGRFGTPIGPNLSSIGGKYPQGYLARWLGDPAAQRPNAHMPKLELAPGEVDALAAYLATLQ